MNHGSIMAKVRIKHLKSQRLNKTNFKFLKQSKLIHYKQDFKFELAMD